MTPLTRARYALSSQMPDVSTSPSKKRRRLSLDALRGVAVFLMIEQHVGIWIWQGPEPGKSMFDYPLLVGFNALGGGAAPLFVSLAGVGSALFVATNRPRTDITLVRRGLVLMGFGLVLNLMAPSWFSWGSWFVLHMMGFAMALAPLWRRMSNKTLLLACGAVLLATPLVQHWLDTPIKLSNPRMRDVTLPGGALRLGLAESQFPILPWLTFYLAGFVAGRFIDRDRIAPVAKLGAAFMLVGAIGHGLLRLGALPLPAGLGHRAFGLQLTFFPASIAIATLLLGGALLFIALVVWFEKRRTLSPNNPMVTLGRASLTLLMLHVPLFRDLSRPVDQWLGMWRWLADVTGLSRVEVVTEHWPVLWHSLSAQEALATIFAFFGISAILTRLWQRFGYKYGAEWALRKLAG